jgi:hypothetical protein
MLEKIAEAVFAYSFAVLEVFFAFFGRTHAVVGLGLPLLVMIAVHLYLSIWVVAALIAFVIAPAAAAMVTMMVEFFLLTRRR